MSSLIPSRRVDLLHSQFLRSHGLSSLRLPWMIDLLHSPDLGYNYRSSSPIPSRIVDSLYSLNLDIVIDRVLLHSLKRLTRYSLSTQT